jgi:hypothetical protein
MNSVYSKFVVLPCLLQTPNGMLTISGYARYYILVPHHGTSVHYEHSVTKQVDNLISEIVYSWTNWYVST